MQINNIIMEIKLMWAGGKDQNVKICADAKWKSINKNSKMNSTSFEETHFLFYNIFL